MTTVFTHKRNYSGSPATQLSTGLNSLSNGSAVESSPYTVPDGVEELTLEAVIASTGAAVASGGYLAVWALRSIDGGSTYEDGSASVIPQRHPDAIILLTPGITTAQRKSALCSVSPGLVKFLLQNNAGASATLASSGNTLQSIPTAFTTDTP